jgi:hypothetical protein
MTRHLELKTAVMNKKSEDQTEAPLRNVPRTKISATHVDVF